MLEHGLLEISPSYDKKMKRDPVDLVAIIKYAVYKIRSIKKKENEMKDFCCGGGTK